MKKNIVKIKDTKHFTITSRKAARKMPSTTHAQVDAFPHGRVEVFRSLLILTLETKGVTRDVMSSVMYRGQRSHIPMTFTLCRPRKMEI